MTWLDVDAFTGRVADLLGSVREALAVIEEAAQSDDDPGWLALSRGYALLVAPMRDYLAGAERGRPLPRQLVRRLEEGRAVLAGHSDKVALLSLHPDAKELASLVAEAEAG